MNIRDICAILLVVVPFIASDGWAEDGNITGAGAASAPIPAAANGSAEAAANGGGAADSSQKQVVNPDAANESPADVIKRLNASLENVLRDAEQLGYKGRLERLSPILDAAFDFDYMARKTVGSRWSTLTPDQQKRWVQLFGDLTKATYAGRFDRYTGQKFELVDEEQSGNDTVVVRSKVVNPGEDDVDLSYRLGKNAAGWKVIDVYFKGTVSELAMRRADYSSVLKRDGFEALVARVNQRIAELGSGKSP